MKPYKTKVLFVILLMMLIPYYVCEADFLSFLKNFINNKKMMYFLLGMVSLLIVYKLPFFQKWLDFLNLLQHELVHMFVAGIFGSTPVAIEVNDKGGSVSTTKSNFIIRLSPYFLPIFCLLILGISLLLYDDYKPAAFILAGLFYGDFIANTFPLNNQPDIQSSGGRLIAYPLICVLNLVVLIGIVQVVK